MTALAALLGAVFAAGVLTLVAALRPATAPAEDPESEGPARRDHVVGVRLERLTLRFGAGLAAAAVIGVVTRWPMAALLVGVAGFMAPSLAGGRAERKARLDRVEGIAAWAEMLRDTMAGAGGLEQSIVVTAQVAPVPIRAEVTRLASRLERERLAPSLRQFADDLGDPTGDLVVAALLLAAGKSPKRLGDLLGRLALSARAEVNMRLRVETGRARTRTSVRVITVFTTVFAAGLLVFNRDYLQPYDSAGGQLVLGAVGACFAGAFAWLAKSFQLAGEERFLHSEASAT